MRFPLTGADPIYTPTTVSLTCMRLSPESSHCHVAAAIATPYRSIITPAVSGEEKDGKFTSICKS